MTDDFYAFLKEPTKENFLKAHSYIAQHEDYNPYSNDLNQMEDLLEKNEFQKALDYANINVMLSPRAHLMKKYAATQLENEEAANAEYFLAMRILEGIESTGDGSKEHPYLVLRVNDEGDLLSYLEEEYQVQQLIQEDIIYDAITTKSGKTIYFDITNCYQKMNTFSMDDFLNNLGISEEDFDENVVTTSEKKKKWWQFWA